MSAGFFSATRSLLASALVVLVTFLIFTAGTAQAAIKTWNAGVNSTWDTTTANWTGSTFATGDDAVFNATGAGNVTLGENISANSLTFNSAGYFIFDGGSFLTLTGSSTITDNAGAQIRTRIAGTGGMTKNGSGGLALRPQAGTGRVLPSGTTTINEGELRINLVAADQDREFGGATNPYVINGDGTSLRFFNTSSRQKFNDAQFNFGSSGGGTVSIEDMNPIVKNMTITTSGGLKNIFTGDQAADLNGQGSTTEPVTFNVVPGTDPSGVDLEFSGNAGNLKMVKNGAGVMTITRNTGNSFGAGIDINAGTLDLAGTGRLNNGSWSRNMLNNATFVHSSTADQILAGAISGSGVIEKNSASLLRLDGANTYTGTTTINSGTFQLNGSHTGAGDYTVNSGGTLAGDGGSLDGTALNVTFQAGSSFDPGIFDFTFGNAANDIFDIEGAVSASETESMLFQVGDDSADTVFMSASTLEIGSGVLEFDDFLFTQSGIETFTTYTLFDAGTINGSLGAFTGGTIGGFAASLEIQGNDLVLVIGDLLAAPEPSTVMLIATGGWILAMARRRHRHQNRG